MIKLLKFIVAVAVIAFIAGVAVGLKSCASEEAKDNFSKATTELVKSSLDSAKSKAKEVSKDAVNRAADAAKDAVSDAKDTAKSTVKARVGDIRRASKEKFKK